MRCTVCGAVGVDAQGYCVGCRAFRGVPTATVPPEQESNRLVAPLLILASVLLVIVAAVVVAVVVVNEDPSDDALPQAAGASSSASPTATPSRSPSPSPSASPTPTPSKVVDQLHDPCLIGLWREVSHQSDIEIEGVGKLRFTGSGALQRFDAIGASVLEYGTGSSISARSGDLAFEYVYTGSVFFNWQTQNGVIHYSNSTANGTATLWRNGVKVSSRHLAGGSTAPEHYTCSGDSLRQVGDGYSIELVRIT